MATKKKPSGNWITVNGQHIMVRSGESKDDAIKRSLDKNRPHKSVIKPQKPQKKTVVGGYQPKIDKLNNLKSGKVKFTHH